MAAAGVMRLSNFLLGDLFASSQPRERHHLFCHPIACRLCGQKALADQVA